MFAVVKWACIGRVVCIPKDGGQCTSRVTAAAASPWVGAIDPRTGKHTHNEQALMGEVQRRAISGLPASLHGGSLSHPTLTSPRASHFAPASSAHMLLDTRQLFSSVSPKYFLAFPSKHSLHSFIFHFEPHVTLVTFSIRLFSGQLTVASIPRPYPSLYHVTPIQPRVLFIPSGSSEP
jgi:hypothetical protein